MYYVYFLFSFLLVIFLQSNGFLKSKSPSIIKTYNAQFATVEIGSKEEELATECFDSICRDDFPILLNTKIGSNKDLIYLDSAASSQKPNCVLEAMDIYFRTSHSNVHRGAHTLAAKATEKYEWARDQVKLLINAKYREEIIFTSGATASINIIAMSLGQSFQPGDEIILSVMEHHSNLVPWQLIAQKTGAVLKFVQLTKTMEFDYEHYASLLSDRTKVVAISYASNVLGVCNPVKNIIQLAHSVGAKVLLDSCQAVPHVEIDVQGLDVDFIVASGHKMCGPTGIGFLYGKLHLLSNMPPVFGGGEMIDRVELMSSTYAPPPSRFEPGTPPIAEAIGLGVACEYLMKITMKKISQHDLYLGNYLYNSLQQLQTDEGLDLYGPPPNLVPRNGLVAFNSKLVHPTDLAFFLDQEGVAVRSGHHCTQPLHKVLNISGSIRASLYFYNNKNDVDVFIEKLSETIKMFKNL